MVSPSHSMFIFKTVSVPQTNFSYELFKYFNVSPHPGCQELTQQGPAGRQGSPALTVSSLHCRTARVLLSLVSGTKVVPPCAGFPKPRRQGLPPRTGHPIRLQSGQGQPPAQPAQGHRLLCSTVLRTLCCTGDGNLESPGATPVFPPISPPSWQNFSLLCSTSTQVPGARAHLRTEWGVRHSPAVDWGPSRVLWGPQRPPGWVNPQPSPPSPLAGCNLHLSPPPHPKLFPPGECLRDKVTNSSGRSHQIRRACPACEPVFSPLTHIWLNSPLFLLRRQMRYDRVPFITETSSTASFSCTLSLPLTLGQTETFLTGALSTWVTLSWCWILFRNATSKVAGLEYQHVTGLSLF